MNDTQPDLLAFFCLTPSLPIRTDGGLYKWDRPVRWWLKSAPGDKDWWTDIHRQATSAWRKHAKVDVAQATNSAEANVIIDAARIDGPHRTLAWAELPTGVELNRPLRTRYDTDEPWNTPKMAFLTAAHEWGHLLGIGHLTQGLALMNPRLNLDIEGPLDLDIAEALARYGAAEPPTEEKRVYLQVPPGYVVTVNDQVVRT